MAQAISVSQQEKGATQEQCKSLQQSLSDGEKALEVVRKELDATKSMYIDALGQLDGLRAEMTFSRKEEE